MPERDEERDSFAPPPGSEPIQMSRAEEISYAQERYQTEGPAPSAPAAKPAPSAGGEEGASEKGAPAAAPAPPPSRAFAAAKLATAALALLFSALFFYPAFHDALRRDRRLLPLARDGEMDVRAPDTSVYLSIDAKPRGATVIVDGRERGTTPQLLNLACAEGARIRVEVTAKGHTPWRDEVACEHGRMISIAPSLAREPRR